jgi:hypothetical protein
MQYDRADLDNQDQIAFLAEEVRDFYSQEIYKWQYFRFDWANSTLYFVQDGNRYIASQGMIPIHLSSGKHLGFTVKSESSFLLPEFRGSSTFVDLYNYTIRQATLDGAQLVWGFTALSKVWRKKLGFYVYDDIITESELQLSVRKSIQQAIINHRKFSERLKRITKELIVSIKTRRISRSLNSRNVRELDLEDEQDYREMSMLFKDWKKTNNNFICIELSKEYLTWRISNNPKLQYKLYGLFRGGQMYGFAIINTTSSYAYLMELIVQSGTQIAEALDDIIVYLKQTGEYCHLTYWASRKNPYCRQVHAALQANGARETVNSSMNFVLKATEHNRFDTSSIDNYYINGLWTEGFSI